MSNTSLPSVPGLGAASSVPDARTANFRTLTTPQALGPEAFAIDIPTSWQQGRGAFGGLVLAILVRALRATEPDAGRALRSLTAALAGPVLPGPAQLSLRELRQGNAVSTRAVELRQPGDDSAAAEVLAHAVAVFGRARVSDRQQRELAPPAVPPWHESPVLPIGPPMAPIFTQHCEFRPLAGLPFSGQSGAAPVLGWVRFRQPGPSWDEAELIAAVDTYWPAMLVSESSPRPMATIAFTAQILYPPEELPPAVPLLYRGFTVAAHDGYVVEQRELWSERGDLVVLNQQTMAFVK